MRYCRTSLSVGLYLLIYTVCSLFMLQFQYVWTMKLNLPVSNTLKWLCFPVLALSLTCNYLKGRLSAGSTVEFKVWYISSRLWFGPSAWVVTGSLGQSGGIILSPRLREASRKCTGLVGWVIHQSLCSFFGWFSCAWVTATAMSSWVPGFLHLLWNRRLYETYSISLITGPLLFVPSPPLPF